MKELTKPTCKSHRSVNLHKFVPNQEIKPIKTIAYLLIQKLNQSTSSDFIIINYLSTNSNSQYTYLPTTKPHIYLENQTNILCDYSIKVNPNLIVHVYWLQSLEILDIFNNNIVPKNDYKINYVQIPINIEIPINVENPISTQVINQEISYVKTFFNREKIYYFDKNYIQNTIDFSSCKLKSIDADIEDLLAIGNIIL